MFSVVIPAHNAANTITACVQALKCQTAAPGPYEVIVVDDGSTDNTAHLAQAAGATVIRQPRQGPANARNTGIHAASGDITCFTDADCVPTSNWLAEITAPLLADPEIAGCKGTYRSDQTAITARFVQLEYEDKYDRLRHYSRITFMDFYSAAYRRHILLANGGFDERFDANSEDRELSYRLAARGYQMVFQPTAVVTHLHTDTLRDYFRKKVFNGYWTAQAVRNFPERTVEDTYTPQVQKVQIGLMGLVMMTTAATLIFPPSALVAVVLLVAFFLTTIPFSRKAWPKDKVIALLAPSLLAIRALALGLGYAWGLLRPLSPPTTTRET